MAKLYKRLNRITVETIELCIYNARQHYGINFKIPTYDLDLKHQKHVGEADLEKNHISLDPTVFVKNIRLFKTDIIPHEVAHLIAYELHDDYTSKIYHGKSWRNIMRECFKCIPSATYDFK